LARELYLRACHLGLRHGLHFGLFVAVSRSPISTAEIVDRRNPRVHPAA
jgi:hypothetical protein